MQGSHPLLSSTRCISLLQGRRPLEPSDWHSPVLSTHMALGHTCTLFLLGGKPHRNVAAMHSLRLRSAMEFLWHIPQIWWRHDSIIWIALYYNPWYYKWTVHNWQAKPMPDIKTIEVSTVNIRNITARSVCFSLYSNPPFYFSNSEKYAAFITGWLQFPLPWE